MRRAALLILAMAACDVEMVDDLAPSPGSPPPAVCPQPETVEVLEARAEWHQCRADCAVEWLACSAENADDLELCQLCEFEAAACRHACGEGE